MGTVRHSGIATAPVDVVFDYVDDPNSVPDWMFGVSRFESIGTVDRGVGSRFAASMRVGPKTVHSTIVCSEWEKDRLIVLKSEDGLTNASRWEFTDLGDGTTKMSVVFDYTLPGGIAGKVLGAVVTPFVAEAVKHSEASLRKNLSTA
ncbi:SRPBCC family protein [Actinomycetes bacterium M1A6_2h]